MPRADLSKIQLRAMVKELMAEESLKLPLVLAGGSLSYQDITASCCEGNCPCDSKCTCDGNGGCSCDWKCACDSKTAMTGDPIDMLGQLSSVSPVELKSILAAGAMIKNLRVGRADIKRR